MLTSDTVRFNHVIHTHIPPLTFFVGSTWKPLQSHLDCLSVNLVSFYRADNEKPGEVVRSPHTRGKAPSLPSKEKRSGSYQSPLYTAVPPPL